MKLVLYKTFMKVLVVGAGPAGLSTAISVFQRDPSAEVVVAEQKSDVGENPRCAGGVSVFIVRKVGVEIPQNAIVARIQRLRMFSPSREVWEFRGSCDYGYVLNRTVFEKYMAEKVERLGGAFVLGRRVRFEDLNKWYGKFDVIVGADGPSSTVRRWLGLPSHSSEDLHVGVQKTVSMNHYPQDTIEIYFGSKIAPKGYVWIFPCGENYVRIGLGVALSEKVNVKKLLDRFIAAQGVEHNGEVIGKLIPTAPPPKTGVYGNVLLVGDALPTTDPLTGGGICQAIASGKAAGKAIAEGNPQSYDTYIGWLTKQNSKRYRLKNALLKLKDKDLDDMIKIMKGFKPMTVSVEKELKRVVVHLLTKKPSLITKLF